MELIMRKTLVVVLAVAFLGGCGSSMTDSTFTVDTGDISRPTVAISGDGAEDGAGASVY